MSKRKVNPRRRPATEADVKKAQALSIDYAWAIMMMVLKDKMSFTTDDLRKTWDGVNALSDSVAKGYVTIDQLMQTLDEEAGIYLMRE